MTDQEYIEGIESLDKTVYEIKSKIVYEYITSNNRLSPGDNAQDEWSMFKIKNIVSYYYEDNFPAPIYEVERSLNFKETKKIGSPNRAYGGFIKGGWKKND